MPAPSPCEPQLKLSSPVLRSVADRFYVEYDWLAGKGDQVFAPTPHCWYKSMDVAAAKLVGAKRTCVTAELTLYVKKDTNLDMVDDEQDWNRLPHFLPVLTRTKALPGGEALETYDVWDEGGGRTGAAASTSNCLCTSRIG